MNYLDITYTVSLTAIILFFIFIAIGLAWNKVVIELKDNVFVTKSSIKIQSIKNSTKFIRDKTLSYHYTDIDEKLCIYYSVRKFFFNTYYLSNAHIINKMDMVNLYQAERLKTSKKTINRFNL